MSEHRFDIPHGTPAGKCRSCHEIIYWITTSNGKKMPVNADGVSHFATCPHSGAWRKR